MRFHHKFMSIGREVALVSALFLILSAFLNWVSTSNVAFSGIKGDGQVTIVLGVLAFIFLFVKRIPTVVSLIMGVIGLGLAIVIYFRIYGLSVEIESVKVGVGIYITMIAGLGIVFGSIGEMLVEKKTHLFYLDKMKK